MLILCICPVPLIRLIHILVDPPTQPQGNPVACKGARTADNGWRIIYCINDFILYYKTRWQCVFNSQKSLEKTGAFVDGEFRMNLKQQRSSSAPKKAEASLPFRRGSRKSTFFPIVISANSTEQYSPFFQPDVFYGTRHPDMVSDRAAHELRPLFSSCTMRAFLNSSLKGRKPRRTDERTDVPHPHEVIRIESDAKRVRIARSVT